LSISLHKRT